ncbi:uncharacterized protein [Drosophila takahashii]|uniref:uncharacterized protein n=1 Tax=Drosophila takahashii TaxID=29030 RepID=UPI003898E941
MSKFFPFYGHHLEIRSRCRETKDLAIGLVFSDRGQCNVYFNISVLDQAAVFIWTAFTLEMISDISEKRKLLWTADVVFGTTPTYTRNKIENLTKKYIKELTRVGIFR